jgi:hypothetical protein
MSNDKLDFLMNWTILSDILRPFLATKFRIPGSKNLSTYLIVWSEIKVFSAVRNKTRLTMDITKKKVPDTVQVFVNFLSPIVAEFTSMVSSFNLQKPSFYLR